MRPSTSPLWYYIGQYKKSFWLGLFFLLITNILDGLSPLLLKEAIDGVTSGTSQSKLIYIALAFFFIMAVLAGTRYLWRTYFGDYHTRAAEDLRQKVYHHLCSLDPLFYSKTQIGDLMSLLVNDIQAFRQAIGSAVLIIVDGVVIIAVVLPIMFKLNTQWTFLTLIFLPLVPLLIRWVTQQIFSLFKIEQENLSLLSAYTQESISGIRVIKGFVREKARALGYYNLNKQYELSQNEVAKVDSMFGPVMQFGVASGSVILIFIAKNDLISGAVSIGTFVVFQRYITKMVWPMTAFGFGFSEYQKGMASYARLQNILNTANPISNSGSENIHQWSSFSVNNLSFKYPSNSKELFKNLNFTIKPGNKLGVIGPIGSGKSTLALILVRLLQPDSGEILFDDTSIADFSIESLRNKVTLVTQEPLLFSMSISENMRLVKPNASNSEIEQVLRDVHIWDELQKLPSGINTELGEKGVNLSGGQKQRLSLARGLLSGAEILILDDVLSAVDPYTEKALILTLEKWQKTSIIITHRLSIIESCSHILCFNREGFEDFAEKSVIEKRSQTYSQLHSHQEKQLKPSESAP